MKSITLNNLTIQFDTDDDGADKHTAINMLDEINNVLRERFADDCPQIFVNAVDDSDIKINGAFDEEDED